MSVRDPYAGRSSEPKAYFTELAAIYERHRPDYPDAAIRVIVDDLPDDAVIADVGCGTGIATRQLAAKGFRVIGIEPDQKMLDVARQACRAMGDRVQFREGTGEATGLDAASVDAVVCAQSFHWFDERAALREFSRVVKTSGRLALMWNIASKSDAFSAGYCSIMDRAGELARQSGRMLKRNDGRGVFHDERFPNAREQNHRHTQMLDWEALLGRVRSASYFPTEGRVRDQLEHDLRELFDRHARDGQVVLRYDTRLILAVKRAGV